MIIALGFKGSILEAQNEREVLDLSEEGQIEKCHILKWWED
jgi:hypothetical protein